MSHSEEQVDKLLEASAEQWRASLPVPAEPDVAGLVRGRGRRTAWPYPAVAGLAAVLVSVAVLAMVVGSLYGVFGPARPSPSPVPSTVAVSPAATQPSASPSTVSTATPALPQLLYLENRGGPAFTIRINGADILTVECGGYPTVTAGQGNVPKLPWDLQIVRVADGTSLFSGQVTELPRWFVQMGDEPLGLGGVVAGPPGPSCPPPATPTSIVTPAPTPTCCATSSTPVPGETLAESNAFWSYWSDRPFPSP